MKHLINVSLLLLLLFLSVQSISQSKQTPAAATYLNPVLGGNYHDTTIVRDGKDYYMTPSAAYCPDGG